MAHLSEWFQQHLTSSGDGFVWAFKQIPANRHLLLPPDPRYMGTWEPLRHVWHVGEYERCQVIPSMAQWLGGDIPIEEAWDDGDDAWSDAKLTGADRIVTGFCEVRTKQLSLLEGLASVDWEQPRDTLWGFKPLKMIVTKTYQHTFEHGDTLLRMALWWDR